MLMWGDRLIDANVMKYGKWEASENGTAPAIDLIPKDIIICDWHYEQRTDYPSVRYFQEKGFRVWPAGWNNVEATQGPDRLRPPRRDRSHARAPLDHVGPGAGRLCPGAAGPARPGPGFRSAPCNRPPRSVRRWKNSPSRPANKDQP